MTGFGYNVNGFGVGGAGAKPLEITFIDSSATAAAASATFSDHDIGTATADRYIVVCASISATANNATDDVTVGGESTTLVVRQQNSPSNNGHADAGIYITDAPYTSGTTADIVVTQELAQNANGFGIGVFTLTGLSSTTATDTAGTTAGAYLQNPAGGMEADIDVSAGGGIIATACGGGYSGSGGSVSWGGVTERYYINGYAISVGLYPSGASLDDQSASTVTVTCTLNDSHIPAMAVASFL